MTDDVGLHVGDEGTAIELDTLEDISTATEVKIWYRKPDNTTGFWAGETFSIGGVTQGVRYHTLAGDLNIAGIWTFRAWVTMPDWSGYGSKVSEQVYSL